MKQAILITAYQDFDNLTEIINFFPIEKFNFYIHIDKKSKIDNFLLSKLNLSNVFIYSHFKVYWGGISHLKAILHLCNKAIENENNSYFHLISGQDFPVKKISHFDSFTNSKINYLENFTLPNSDWKEGGLDRIELFNFFDFINGKKYNKLLYKINKLQRIFKIKRKIEAHLPPFFGGATWWSLSKEALNYIVGYTKENPALINRLKYSFCSEEIYFQTILMNSDFRNKVVNDNLRYIDWVSNRGGYPAFLDDTDYEKILTSTSLFARKLNNTSSKNLKEKIKEIIL